MASSTLPSSPPQQDLPSPVLSQYSIDFNALAGDHSQPSSPLPTRHVRQIRSEDIDGPSDFTINMERWMRGTGKVGTGRRIPSKARPGEMRDRSQQFDTRQNSTPVKPSERSEHATLPPVTQEDVPRLASSPRITTLDVTADALATPTSRSGAVRLVPSTHNLQPTVEDFQSEIVRTPAHLTDVPTVSESTTNPSVRPTRGLKSDAGLEDLRQQLDDLQKRLQHAESQSSSFQQRLVQADEEAKAHVADLERRDQQLAAAESARDAAEADTKRYKAEVEEMCDSEDAEMHNLRCQLRNLQAVASEPGEDVKTLRRERDSTMVAHNKTIMEWEGKVNGLSGQLAESELRSTASANEIERLKCQLSDERRDRERVEKELEELNKEAELLRDLSRLNDIPIMVHESATSASAIPPTVQGVEPGLYEEALLALEGEKQKTSRFDAEVSELCRQVHLSQTKTAESERARLDLHTRIDSLVSDLDSTNAELAALRDTNRAFDARVSDAVKRREEHWRAKQASWVCERDDARRERAFMVKALMRQWGREECGAAEEATERIDGQRFMYRFAAAGSRPERKLDVLYLGL